MNSFGSPLPIFRVKNVDVSIDYYLDAVVLELQGRAGDGFGDRRFKWDIDLTGTITRCFNRRNFLSLCRI
jgi:hypothetical protein